MTQTPATRRLLPVPWNPMRRTSYCFGLSVVKEGFEWTDTSNRVHFLFSLPGAPLGYPTYVIWEWNGERKDSVFWAFDDEAVARLAFAMSDDDRDTAAKYHVEIGMHTPWFMAYVPEQVHGDVALVEEL